MANNKNNGSVKAKAEMTKNSTAQASAKKQSQNKGSKNKNKNESGLISYFKGVRQEFRKVVWPTKEELTTDTVVVIACVIFFAVAFWLVDTGFLAALKGILGITLS